MPTSRSTARIGDSATRLSNSCRDSSARFRARASITRADTAPDAGPAGKGRYRLAAPRHAGRRSCGVAVGDLQRLVQDGEALAELGLGDGAGRDDVGAVEMGERPQPALLARGRE